MPDQTKALCGSWRQDPSQRSKNNTPFVLQWDYRLGFHDKGSTSCEYLNSTTCWNLYCYCSRLLRVQDLNSSSPRRADVNTAKKIMMRTAVPETQPRSPASGRSRARPGWGSLCPRDGMCRFLRPCAGTRPQQDGCLPWAVPWESWQHPCNALGWETAVGLEAAVSVALLHVAPAPGAAQLLNWSKGWNSFF